MEGHQALREDNFIKIDWDKSDLVEALQDAQYKIAWSDNLTRLAAQALIHLLLEGTARAVVEMILRVVNTGLNDARWSPAAKEILYVRTLLSCADYALGHEYIDEGARPPLDWPTKSRLNHAPFQPASEPSAN